MPKTTETAFDFRGFHSLREYEAECARVGFTTRRVPFRKGSEKYFALVTTPPGHPTGTSIEAWTLFTADETVRVLDGIISGGAFMHATPMQINGILEPGYLDENGVDKNWLGKLYAHGYYPEEADGTCSDSP